MVERVRCFDAGQDVDPFIPILGIGRQRSLPTSPQRLRPRRSNLPSNAMACRWGGDQTRNPPKVQWRETMAQQQVLAVVLAEQ